MPTAIYSIHGQVPRDEYPDRGQLVPRHDLGYIPYLSLTQGEMRLMLLREQARIYAAAFPDLPQYRQAVSMLGNALNAGVSRGVSFVGALDGDVLQQVAREINKAVKNQRPASRAGFMGRESIGTGIGDIPVSDRLAECLKKANSPTERAKCFSSAKIEEILNGGITKSGHHLLYKNLGPGDNLPTEVVVKKNNHQLGVEGMAVVGSISDAKLMYQWVETAILNRNASAQYVGPYSSRQASFMLGGKEGIGVIGVATITAITTLVSAALGGALALLKELRSQKAYAMIEAKGFATDANSAKTEDWPGDVPAGEESGTGNGLLLLGAAAAGLLLLSK